MSLFFLGSFESRSTTTEHHTVRMLSLLSSNVRYLAGSSFQTLFLNITTAVVVVRRAYYRSRSITLPARWVYQLHQRVQFLSFQEAPHTTEDYTNNIHVFEVKSFCLTRVSRGNWHDFTSIYIILLILYDMVSTKHLHRAGYIHPCPICCQQCSYSENVGTLQARKARKFNHIPHSSSISVDVAAPFPVEKVVWMRTRIAVTHTFSSTEPTGRLR